jgi:hypothetical protein
VVFVVAEAETARVTLFDGDIMYGNHVNNSLDLIDGEGRRCRRGRDEGVRVRERERGGIGRGLRGCVGRKRCR